MDSTRNKIPPKMPKKLARTKTKLVRKKQIGGAGRCPGCHREHGDHHVSVWKWRTHVYKAHIVARLIFFSGFILIFPFSLPFLVRKSIFKGSCFPHTMLRCCWATVGFHHGLPCPSLGLLGAKNPNQPQDWCFWGFSPRKMIHRHK